MSRFSIAVVKRDTEPHVARYDDFCCALGQALRDIGHEVVPASDQKPGRLIMFNMNNVFDPGREVPEDAILFNTEQVAAVAYPRDAFTAYKDHQDRVIWDYSEANVEVLRQRLEMKRVILCPVGYHPSMSYIESAPVQDVDVLFYGAITPHRARLLHEVGAHGLGMKTLYGVFGKERDAWIARSKVVLNLHYGFEHGAIFEIFRVSHLAANRKCVVSEMGITHVVDRSLQSFGRALTVSAYDIPRACRRYADSQVEREAMEHHAFAAFSSSSLVDNVRRALEQS